MIEATKAYKVGALTFGTLEEAQVHEIRQIIQEVPGWNSDEDHKRVAEFIVGSKDKILNVLTTGPRSHPKARKANGATRKKSTPQPASA